jgi:O-antigen/teichoic acid export membrane protein
VSIFNSKIIKNFSVLTGTSLLIQVLSILSSIRLARQLQPIGYGLFNLVTLQVTIFSIVSVFGLRIVVIRHIARYKQDARKIFKVSNQIRIITTIVALLLAAGYSLLHNKQSLPSVLSWALLLLIIFQSFWDSIDSVSFGFEKMQTSGVINLIMTVIWITEIYLIPNRLFTVKILLIAYVINQGARTLIYYVWLRQNILRKIPFETITGFTQHKLLIRQSNFYFILALFTSIQSQIPILLLQFNSHIDQIGLFNLGNRILSPLQMMLSMLLTALFPMLSRLAIDNKPLFAQRIKSLLNIITLTGIWGSLCFSLFSKDIVKLLYGNAYITTANVILVQCWFTVLFAIFCTIGTVLSALDKQKLLATLSIFYGVIASPIFYFGTRYGAIGLAWSFVIAAFLNMTYHWIIFRNLLEKRLSIKYSIIMFSSIGVLAFVTYRYKVEFSLIYRLSIGILLSLALFSYIYKVEYSKLSILINKMPKQNLIT